MDDLTETEARAAQLAADGRTNREIGYELFLTPKSVEGVLGRVYGKLGIRRRAELASRPGRPRRGLTRRRETGIPPFRTRTPAPYGRPPGRTGGSSMSTSSLRHSRLGTMALVAVVGSIVAGCSTSPGGTGRRADRRAQRLRDAHDERRRIRCGHAEPGPCRRLPRRQRRRRWSHHLRLVSGDRSCRRADGRPRGRAGWPGTGLEPGVP